MNSRAELQQRVWYRMLKVLYIFCFLLVLLIVEYFAFISGSPQKFVDDNKTLIQCTDGKSYLAGPNGIHLDGDYVSRYQDERIRELCRSTSPPIEKKSPQAPTRVTGNVFDQIAAEEESSNYRVTFSYATTGSWYGVAMRCVAAFLGVYLVFALVKRIFFYVAVGRFWA